MKVVIGLGNPGRTYERTRHNAGFDVADALAKRWGGSFRSSIRFRLQSCKVEVEGGGGLWILKPQTFMNLSGDAVEPWLRKHGVPVSDVVVVYDDVDLPAGVLRIRKSGSAGGHNGMKSVLGRLGTNEVVRVRIGVGRMDGSGDLKDHVLSKIPPEEAETVADAVKRAADAVSAMVRFGVDRAMNEYNG